MSNIDLNLHDFIQINDIQNIVNEARENDTDMALRRSSDLGHV